MKKISGREGFLTADFSKVESIMEVSTKYNGYSIFKDTATTEFHVDGIVSDFAKSEYKDDVLMNRALGCIMAHVIGDSMGSVLEFQDVSYTRKIITDFSQDFFDKGKVSTKIVNAFNLKVGQYTDDSSMALCLADTLLVCKKVDQKDLRLRFLRWWMDGYNNAFRFDAKRAKKTSVGLGGNIAESFQEILDNKEITEVTNAGSSHTSGNGSIMRLSPVALYYHDDVIMAMKEAERQSLTTHKGIEAADCCKLLAYVIVKALHFKDIYTKEEVGFAKRFLDSLDMKEVMAYLTTEGGRCLAKSEQEATIIPNMYAKDGEDRNWNWKQPGYKFSPTRASQQPGYIGSYAMDALCMALHCVYSTNSVGEAVMKAANLGGDADSLAAVTGQMAGAIYGLTNIDPEWSKAIMNWDNKGEIPLRAMCCIKKELLSVVLDES